MSRNLRAQISRWFSAIAFEHQSASSISASFSSTLNDSRQIAFSRQCIFGACRQFESLDWFLTQLMEKPIKAKEKEVKALLFLGIYQLYYLDTPDHAVLSESVNACRQLKRNWASRLVNGVLRNAIRRKSELLTLTGAPESASHNCPTWLLNRLKIAWPDDWEDICIANNEQAPLTLRLNESHIEKNHAESLLNEVNLTFIKHEKVNSAVKLDSPCSVAKIPEFASGLFSVQDLSAQIAGHLLPVKKNDYVLDACAAPGGKTGHLLERHTKRSIHLVSLENDKNRAIKITENLTRLNFKSEIVIDDASTWQATNHFDAILLDAPCSATGVIRRQPDIKLHRLNDDIEALCSLQLRILNNLWCQLKSKGYLLYATCSILPDENSQQISKFLSTHDDANLMSISQEFMSLGTDTGYGLQIFPKHWHDGFFYSLLQKH